MGIQIETHTENARAFLNNKRKILTRSNIGLVVVARLDPRLAGGDPVLPGHNARVRKFSNSVAEITKKSQINDKKGSSSKGQVLITIGSGRQRPSETDNYSRWYEFRLRQKTLGMMKTGLAKAGGFLIHQTTSCIADSDQWLIPELSDLEFIVANSPIRKFQS
jgi:hypothetical protein